MDSQIIFYIFIIFGNNNFFRRIIHQNPFPDLANP